ncbi:MAG: cytochrome c3 family protein [Deltaproteobacteria bacterium]|nr:cytochrome c3 family protein [Deltaproteobacteria bacterium]
MKRNIVRALFLVLAFSLSAAFSSAQTAPGTKDTTKTCLSCHGPYDKLRAAGSNYVWPKGEKHSPHMYVRHNTKDIPECINCHKVHAMPPTPAGTAAMGKANPEYCFTCHHTKELTCGTCHEAPN